MNLSDVKTLHKLSPPALEIVAGELQMIDPTKNAVLHLCQWQDTSVPPIPDRTPVHVITRKQLEMLIDEANLLRSWGA